jgi:hypothetical protein
LQHDSGIGIVFRLSANGRGESAMSKVLCVVFVSAGLLAPAVFAQKAQGPGPSSKTPTALTMAGCVSTKPEAAGQYTFAETDGLREYRLSGKGINKFAGKRVELVGGTPGKGLSIRTGLWPAPSGGARGVALDPVQGANRRQSGGGAAGGEIQEFRVSRVRLIDGTCE